MNLLPLLSRPGIVVHAVGDVTNLGKLLREVALVHVGQDFPGHFAVQHGHAVHVLGAVGCQHAHAEALHLVGRVDLAHCQEGVPLDTETGRIVAEILREEFLVEGVVACRNGGMGGEETAGANQFHCLFVHQTAFLHVFTQPFQADECGVAFVAVVDGRTYAHNPQCPDTANAQQDFLLETVFPVAAVELIGDLAVLLHVVFEVGIQEVEVGAADADLPDTGVHHAAGHLHGDGHPVAVLVGYRLCRNLEEVLGVVFRHLIALRGEPLGEIAVTVEQADSDHVNVHVAALLEVVAGQDAQTSGIDLQAGVEPVFHAEICDGRGAALGLAGHIGVELVHHRTEIADELLVLRQLVIPLEADRIQDNHRVMSATVPNIRIYVFEQCFCVVVPAPPKILTQSLQARERLREVPRDPHTRPTRRVGLNSLLHMLRLL